MGTGQAAAAAPADGAPTSRARLLRELDGLDGPESVQRYIDATPMREPQPELEPITVNWGPLAGLLALIASAVAVAVVWDTAAPWLWR